MKKQGEYFTMNKHIHIITFRGCFPIDIWNRLIKFLYDNGIKYKTKSEISPTRDDAGLLKYYERVIFQYDKYIPYETNRKRITEKEFLELLKKEVI
jgi:phage antirepressor YoqD-like protein